MGDSETISNQSIVPGGSLNHEVLAVVSHDLRTPLNTISVGAALLDECPQSESERTVILRMIRRSAERMDRLIRDLTTVTCLDAGRSFRVEPRRMNLVPLLRETHRALAPQAEKAGQRLDIDVPGRAMAVMADSDRVFQVLSNLVGNAMKFTPRGGHITLAVRRRANDALVCVSDNGPGIAEGEVERVFDPFWQAEHTAGLGTGLGLKIAKAIVEAHDGRIWVESGNGSGTTFSFTLPRVARGHA